MSAPNTSLWPSRLSALVLAAVAAGSALAWGLKLRAPTEAALPAAAEPGGLQVDASVVARALGAGAAEALPQSGAPLASSRLVLVGVVASAGRAGSALIAIDGKPPKPVVVGGRVGEDWVLDAVAPRRAALRSAGASGEALTLEMPQPMLPRAQPQTP